MALKAEEVYAILKKKIESGGATPEQIQTAVDDYLSRNPVTVGELKVVNHIVSIGATEGN